MPRHNRNKAAATLHGQAIIAVLGEEIPRLQEESSPQTNEFMGESPRGLLMKCPSCGKRMELDPGFAGSVCRCNHCKALITVPGELQAESVPVIRRSDRPDSPQGHMKSKSLSHGMAASTVDTELAQDHELRIPLPASLETPNRAHALEECDPIAAFAAQRNRPTPIRDHSASRLTPVQWGVVLGVAGGIGLLVALALVEVLL